MLIRLFSPETYYSYDTALMFQHTVGGKPAIACEISLSSTPDQEIGNLQKCLKAGYPEVALISPKQQTLNKVRELAGAGFNEKSRSRIKFLTPADFLVFLEGKRAEAAGPQETVVRGDRFHHPNNARNPNQIPLEVGIGIFDFRIWEPPILQATEDSLRHQKENRRTGSCGTWFDRLHEQDRSGIVPR